jgi:hypothetical protein
MPTRSYPWSSGRNRPKLNPTPSQFLSEEKERDLFFAEQDHLRHLRGLQQTATLFPPSAIDSRCCAPFSSLVGLAFCKKPTVNVSALHFQNAVVPS